MMGPELQELISAAKRAAGRWNKAKTDLAAAQSERDRQLWRFLARAVKIARANRLRSAKRIGKLVRQLNPALDSKASSRYGRIVRAIVKWKPANTGTRDWVKRHGGISPFRYREAADA